MQEADKESQSLDSEYYSSAMGHSKYVAVVQTFDQIQH